MIGVLNRVVVVIVVAAVTGCSAPTDADRSGTGQLASGGDAPARELTDAELGRLRTAEELLVKKCMGQRGFQYWPAPQLDADVLKGRGPLLTDVDWAREHGYGSRLAEELEQARLGDPNHAYANALPANDRVRYGKALDGQRSGGVLTAELPGGGTIQIFRDSCWAKAKQQLYGDLDAWFQAEKTAMHATGLYQPDLVEDERFRSAVVEWSTCMRHAGHDYASPPEVRQGLPGLTKGMSAEEGFAVEVGLAVADATCATTTPLADTARALESEYRHRGLQPVAEEMATYRRMAVAALSRVQDIAVPTHQTQPR